MFREDFQNLTRIMALGLKWGMAAFLAWVILWFALSPVRAAGGAPLLFAIIVGSSAWALVSWGIHRLLFK